MSAPAAPEREPGPAPVVAAAAVPIWKRIALRIAVFLETSAVEDIEPDQEGPTDRARRRAAFWNIRLP